MELAPIVLFTYIRPNHTKRVLESLYSNELSSKSKLYVFCDGPKVNAPKSDIIEIDKLRTLVKSKQWCSEVEIIEQTENKGLSASIINGVTAILNIHDKIIVLEDDLVLGKYFLNFMNDALFTYKNEHKVFGISGYKYPLDSHVNRSTFFLPISSSWSFATWKNRWSEVNFNGKELLTQVNKENKIKKIDFGNYPFYNMLKNQVEGRVNSWAIRYYTSMFLKNNFFLYPNQSLVQNIGFDGSGVHCTSEDFFSKINVCNDKIVVNKLKIRLVPQIVSKFKKQFKKQFKLKEVPLFKRIILKIIHW